MEKNVVFCFAPQDRNCASSQPHVRVAHILMDENNILQIAFKFNALVVAFRRISSG